MLVRGCIDARDDQGLDGNGEARRHLRGRGLCSEDAGGSAHLWVILASQLVVEVVVAVDNGQGGVAEQRLHQVE